MQITKNKTALKSIRTLIFVSLIAPLLLASATVPVSSQEDVTPPMITSGTIIIDDTEFSCADLVSHDVNRPYTITVHAVDNVGIDSVILSYSLSYTGQSNFFTRVMTAIGGDYYRSEIPGQPYGTTILYFVTAYDSAGNFHIYEHTYHDPFIVRVLPMISEPSITINGEEYPLSDENLITFDNEGTYRVKARCYTSTGIDSVVLNYQRLSSLPLDPYIRIPMVHIGGDFYIADIPEQPYGTRILLYIEATCGAGHPEICEKTNNDPFHITLGPIIHSTVDLNPNTLNLKSKGKWITCYIELSEGYSVEGIDVGSIKLIVTGGEFPVDLEAPTTINDYDGDGIPERMVKFDRSEVATTLSPGATVELTVTGELTDGTLFEGSDTLRVK